MARVGWSDRAFEEQGRLGAELDAARAGTLYPAPEPPAPAPTPCTPLPEKTEEEKIKEFRSLVKRWAAEARAEKEADWPQVTTSRILGWAKKFGYTHSLAAAVKASGAEGLSDPWEVAAALKYLYGEVSR